MVYLPQTKISSIGLHLELNFLWAAHQVHHSSEEYNLTTALRQSIMQKFGSWVNNLAK